VAAQRLAAAKDAKETKGKDESNARGLGLEQLGVLLAALHEHKRKQLEAPLVFPEVRPPRLEPSPGCCARRSSRAFVGVRGCIHIHSPRTTRSRTTRAR
jgi:hypothetical protein